MLKLGGILEMLKWVLITMYQSQIMAIKALLMTLNVNCLLILSLFNNKLPHNWKRKNSVMVIRIPFMMKVVEVILLKV